jgi:hypothetical protein
MLPSVLYRYRYRIIFAVVMMLTLVVVAGHDTHATMAQNSRLRYGNAWDYCHMPENNSDGRYWAWGMVWLSNNESDYYSEEVNVGTNDTSVRVSIRGAANTCETSFSRRTSFYAINVSASVLTGLSGNSFYRGDAPSRSIYTWTTEGSKLYGDVNVSGVATCSPDNMSGRATGTVTIYLTRTQYQTYEGGGTYTSTDPATEAVPVNIVRQCPTYDYSLTPTITDPSDNNTVDSGSGPRTVKGNIHNNGPTISKPNTQWRLTQIVYSPSVGTITNRSGGDTSQDPCSFFTGGNCTTLDSGTDDSAYTSGGNQEHEKDTNITDYEVGTKVCFALSVNPYTHSNNDWRHSPLSCLIVSKSPKVNVLGGDLIVGRGSATNPSRTSQVRTSISNTTSNGLFGSWSEYGIIPTGIVTGMASGSGYVGGSPSSNLCGKLSVLTFTNANATGSCSESSVGNYPTTSTAPSIAARFPVNSSTPSLTGVVDIASKSGLFRVTDATLTIASNGAIPAGRWVVINAPNTTITITRDIRYTTDSLTSISQIPQVVIIAKNIIIADKDTSQPGNPPVTQIDSWLVAVGSGADGRINTCGAGTVGESTALNSRVCDAKLTVNGPITANHLILRRTAGAGIGSNAGDPAEVFNLRSDAYIWATSYSPGTGRLPTVTTKEIPPRF